ncbi:MAG: hypothetical protein WCB79_06105 [Halobacteriota archaeon]
MNATQSEKNKHDLLLAQGKIAPCIGCHEVCNPEYCSLLDEWLELLMQHAHQVSTSAVE